MAKMTLIQMVQNILSDLSSDDVNSISDTVEAYQIANTIQSVYFDILADDTIPEHFALGQLTALGDTDLPNYMLLPTGVRNVQWIKYDKHTTAVPKIEYTTIKYKTPEAFLNMVEANDSTADNVSTIIDTSGVKLLIRNDKFPEWFTTYDDEYIIFDSFNQDEESSLTATRSSIWCSFEPTFTLSDDHIPDLDSNLFPLFLAEAKSLCFVNNTQAANAKVEQIAKRHQNHKQGQKHRLSIENKSSSPDYGRKR